MSVSLCLYLCVCVHVWHVCRRGMEYEHIDTALSRHCQETVSMLQVNERRRRGGGGCAVLCCALMCYNVLCCVVLCCAVLCCAVL